MTYERRLTAAESSASLARAVLHCLAFAIVISVAFSAPGQVWVGAGTDDNLSTSLNWSPSPAPLSSSSITFAGTTRLTPFNDFVDAQWGQLSFSADAGSFLLQGNPITLTGDIANYSSSVQEVRLDLTLTANHNLLAQEIGEESALKLSGALSGPANLNKIGPGEVHLSGDNPFEGQMSISAGTLLVTSLSNTPDGAGFIPQPLGVSSGAISISGGGALEYRAVDEGDGATLDRGIQIGAGGGSVQATGGQNLTLGTGGSGAAVGLSGNGNPIRFGRTDADNNTIFVNSVISGVGSSVTLNGGAVVHLVNDNTFTGSLAVVHGKVVVPSILSDPMAAQPLGKADSPIVFGSSAPDTPIVINGLNYTGAVTATLNRDIELAGPSAAIIEVSDPGATLHIGNVTGTEGALLVAGSGNLAVDGVISGLTGGVTHSGDGTLTLTAVNTYTGKTMVDGGTLHVAGSIASSTLTEVFTSGIITGVGETGDLQVYAGGAVAPGAVTGPGTLSVAGDAYFGLSGLPEGAQSGSYLWEITDAAGPAGDAYDQLHVSGALIIASESDVPFIIKIVAGAVQNWDPEGTFSWKIVDSEQNAVSGFAADKFVIDISDFVDHPQNQLGAGGAFTLSSAGGDLHLNYATPEPTPAVLFGATAVALFSVHRRPHRHRALSG